jgi:hypothetical protein
MVVSVTRDGRTIAALDYSAAGGGGWLLSKTEACQGIGLG